MFVDSMYFWVCVCWFCVDMCKRVWKAGVVWAQRVTYKRDKSGSLDAICMIIYILLNPAARWPGITVQSGETSFWVGKKRNFLSPRASSWRDIRVFSNNESLAVRPPREALTLVVVVMGWREWLKIWMWWETGGGRVGGRLQQFRSEATADGRREEKRREVW